MAVAHSSVAVSFPAVQRVEFSIVEDARRLVVAQLEVVPERSRGRVAGLVCAALRDAGFFTGSVEQHYSAVQVGQLLGRTPEYVSQQIRKGEFGAVFRDEGGWIIPASRVQAWLERREFGPDREVGG